MGLREKFNRLWASINDTNKSDPDDTVTNKVINGMGDDQQLPYDWFNWELDRIERRLQNNAQNSPGPMPPGLTRDQLVQKKFSLAGQEGRYWSHMYDDRNTFDFGSDEIADLALYYPPGQDEHCRVLVLNTTDNDITEIDTVDSSTRNSGSFGDLPTGGGEVWQAVQFCSDNEYIYIVFVDGAATNNIRIQAYSLVDWSKHSGWPATGIGIAGAGISSARRSRIIDVNSTQLCFLDPSLTIATSSTAALRLLNKSNGTITDSGAGDATTGASYVANRSLCTDGSYIYFTILNLGASSKICSADITDLTQGIGSGGWPYAPIATNGLECDDLIYDGKHVISLWWVYDSDLGPIVLSTVADSSHTKLLLQNELANYYLFNACFDGRNIWVRGDHKNDDKPIIFSLNLGGMSDHFWEYLSTPEPSNSLVDRVYAFDPEAAYSVANAHKRMIFDGSSIWAISFSFSGTRKVRRIPNIAGV